MQPEPQLTGAVEVFYSYAHEDERLKDELLKHLANIERQQHIVSWHDRKITAGREWAGEIDEHINTAGLILLLVSPDFMASGYCNDVELTRAMERHEAGEARVIPVILRPVDWKGAPFEKLKALPTDGRPVTRRRSRDAALLEVAQGVREAVEEIAARPTSKAPRKTRDPNIPRPPIVGFVARRDEQGRDIVQLLGQELAPDKNQLVALWGPGGSGKTTLAAEFARETSHAFRGRVAWVSALGRADFGLATLLDEVATRLGRQELRKLAPEPKAAEVVALVSSAPTLAVLDNFDTIGSDAQTLCLDFLAQHATCPALITTRARVNRDDTYNIPLAAMTREEARDFLHRLVERTRRPANFARLDRDELIARCEANPLVLQWVVSQIDLSMRPQDVLDDLASGDADAAKRVFTRSYNLPQVGDDGRTALLALSLFTPNASRGALAEVSGFGGDLRRLNGAVENLSALWLVDTTEGNERIFLRGLTRELSKSRLARDGRAGEFRRRFVAHFRRYARAHSHKTPEDLDALEAEKENVLAALDIAFATRDWAGVIAIRKGLGYFFLVRGYWDEAIRTGGQAEAAARETNNDWCVAFFTSDVAGVRRERGELADAERIYLEALAIFRREGKQQNVATTLHQLAWIKSDQGNFDEAWRLYSESLAINRRIRNRAGIASNLNNMGEVARARGEIKEAQQLFDKSLKINVKIDNRRGIAYLRHQLGTIAHSLNEFDRARQLYNESLEVKRSLKDKSGIAYTLRSLGRLEESKGNIEAAAQLFQESWAIFKGLGSSEAERLLADLARVKGKTA